MELVPTKHTTDTTHSAWSVWPLLCHRKWRTRTVVCPGVNALTLTGHFLHACI